MLPWLAHCVSSFCLGRLGRLSLRACRSSFSRFRLAEDKIVLNDVSWQLGLSLLILGCFFLLGVGLGLCMKWARDAEFFDPTTIIYIWFMDEIFRKHFYYPDIVYFMRSLYIVVMTLKKI